MSTTASSTSQFDEFPVYTGLWTNWSRGYVLGATLTLHRRDADLLIAFTASFISFVATRVWRILCFIFHQLYSTANPQDVIYHQRQAILRNFSSPESGVQMLIHLLWKNRRSRNWIRLLPAALAATFCVTAFVIAGGFSSQISTALGNEVLIKSMNCGYGNHFGNLDFSNGSSPSTVHVATKINNAASYAQQCYSDDSTGIVDCSRYVKGSVSKRIDRNASCPFHSDLCRKQSENLFIDSGYIDSHTLLGLNAPVNERIQFKNVLHCAPLDTNKFTSDKNISVGLTTEYHYGGVDILGEDYVFAAKSIESQYSDVLSTDFTASSANFGLESFGINLRNGIPFRDFSDFTPIDAMVRKDADTYIFFLVGNGVLYSEPSLDPWYRATTPRYVPFVELNSTREITYYIPDEPATPLGCIQQHQFCTLTSLGIRECGPLASRLDAIAGAAPLFNSTYDGFTKDVVPTEKAARFLYFTSQFNELSIGIYGVVTKLGSSSLDSQKKLLGGFQESIPSNQWQLDVAHWWDIVMAGRQWNMLENAYFSQHSEALIYRGRYTEKVYQKLCNNQRLAHEELGFGTWSEVTETIPLTKTGELLGSLDITDPDHPTLCRSSNQDSLTLHEHTDTETLPHTPIGDEAASREQSPDLDLDTISLVGELRPQVGETSPVTTADNEAESEAQSSGLDSTTVPVTGNCWRPR
ncbi:hypothetical protein NPX13_g6215 [Xylaria arbuscula]|uniref:Uncharacterized protein n=1 Tax=Xylaria arbuscula TaxID=114810 RepID=A0A9W8NCX9_9PEZI|nr:hypothetical protein NPX13_g6215 [Xylaria arbuscula]